MDYPASASALIQAAVLYFPRLEFERLVTLTKKTFLERTH